MAAKLVERNRTARDGRVDRETPQRKRERGGVTNMDRGNTTESNEIRGRKRKRKRNCGECKCRKRSGWKGDVLGNDSWRLDDASEDREL